MWQWQNKDFESQHYFIYYFSDIPNMNIYFLYLRALILYVLLPLWLHLNYLTPHAFQHCVIVFLLWQKKGFCIFVISIWVLFAEEHVDSWLRGTEDVPHGLLWSRPLAPHAPQHLAPSSLAPTPHVGHLRLSVICPFSPDSSDPLIILSVLLWFPFDGPNFIWRGFYI